MSKNKQHILCLGISHSTAGVACREKLAFSPHHLNASLARVGCGHDECSQDIHELVILSTCNRVELYAVTSSPKFAILEDFLAATRNLDLSDISHHFYRFRGQQVVNHLLQVSAGLDSVVLGEPQILGQVSDAYSAALRHGTAGKILSKLFHTAISAGKRARTETAISHNPASVASVSVKLISDLVPDIKRARIMVIGAGEMAELVVESLRKRSADQITVVNRTLEKARELAGQWDGRAASLEMLINLLADTDILITSTGAPHTIIHTEVIEQIMADRPDRPLVVMDIAVPRDVETTVGDITGVNLFDMDTLDQMLQGSLAKRAAEIPRVEEILSEESAVFMEFLSTLDVVPVIANLRRQAEAIRQAEIEKTIRRMPDLPPEAQEQIDALTRSIVKKILHSPTIRLREAANGPDAMEYVEITRGLFGLE